MAIGLSKVVQPLRLDPKTIRRLKRTIAALKPGEVWAWDHPLTYEEFCQLVEEDDRAELFDGVIYMSPAPAVPHESVFGFLFSLLHTYVHASMLGEVFGSRTAVRLDLYNAPQPDILFVSRRRRRIIRLMEVAKAPDLVMEIAWSKSSRLRAMTKLIRFERFGVPELWFIDLQRRLARVRFHNRKTRRYEVFFEGSTGVIASQVVPGFVVKAEWLWSKPGRFPSVLSVVQELLAGNGIK